MNERPIRPIRPGGQLSASEINRALQRIDKTSDFAGPGVSDEMGQVIIDNPQPLKTNVRILSGSNPYAWEEVRQLEDTSTIGTGSWIATGILSGTVDSNPLVERNGETGADAGDIYEATFDSGPSGIGRWYFNMGGGVAGEFEPCLDDALPAATAAYKMVVQHDEDHCFRTVEVEECEFPMDLYGGTLP